MRLFSSLFLFSSLSVIEFESKESQSLETPAFAQESDEDFTKGGYHVATGKWWEPVGYTQSVDDWDGDGFENSLDSFPLDSARPQLDSDQDKAFHVLWILTKPIVLEIISEQVTVRFTILDFS